VLPPATSAGALGIYVSLAASSAAKCACSIFTRFNAFHLKYLMVAITFVFTITSTFFQLDRWTCRHGLVMAPCRSTIVATTTSSASFVAVFRFR
jgi:hypothetical protein